MKLLLLALVAFISIAMLADDKADFEAYKKSAEQGNATAQCSLGRCYLFGKGVVRDEKKAIEWYQKSAGQGNEDAKNDLKEIEQAKKDLAQVEIISIVQPVSKPTDSKPKSVAKKTGWEVDGLKGKVKENIRLGYDIKGTPRVSDINNLIKILDKAKHDKGNKTLGITNEDLDAQLAKEIAKLCIGQKINQTVCRYDSKGNRIEQSTYSADGSLNTKYLDKHDDKGNITEQAGYNAVGTLTSKNIYKYDIKGMLIEDAYYATDGVLFQKLIYMYDENGNRIEATCYNSDGVLDFKDNSKYDEKGKQIEGTLYSADGSLEFKDIFKYDEKGNMIEQQGYKDGALRKKSIYKCDENGNRIVEAEYDKNGTLVNIRTASYTYY
ncbi:MAG: hypothetical protein WAX69_15410 [Victivallales bacterium]